MPFALVAEPLFARVKPSTHITPTPDVTTKAVGKGGVTAILSVYRVLCFPQATYPKGMQGTGFLHASQQIITAAHVVDGCNEVVIQENDGSKINAKVVVVDDDLDLALLKPEGFLVPTYLKIAKNPDLNVGTQVTTWGFPAGYGGNLPLLGVGYISGSETAIKPDGKGVSRWVVNAAFNHGNSGGPLIDEDTGEVVGVVNAKIIPLSEESLTAMTALKANSAGMQYTATDSNGKTYAVSEGQVIDTVLLDLASQVQLVIGYATTNENLRMFLQQHDTVP